jgi:hypothetical protein
MRLLGGTHAITGKAKHLDFGSLPSNPSPALIGIAQPGSGIQTLTGPHERAPWLAECGPQPPCLLLSQAPLRTFGRMNDKEAP